MNNKPNISDNEKKDVREEALTPKKRKVRAIDFVMIAVCFLAACFIWLYVTGIENGEYEYTFSDVVVNVDGASSLLHEQGLSLVTEQEYKVNITVKGNRREIMKYASEDFFAHIDVDSINSAGKHSLSIITETPAKNITIVSTSPSVLNILVDETATKQVPIQTALHYNIADYITLHDPIPEVDTIEVMGPKSKIEQISYARVEYDLGTVTTSTNFKAPITLCDDLGVEIVSQYIKASMNEITVKVKVTATAAIMLTPEYTASDGDAYDYKVTFAPESLTLVGDPAVISKLEKLTVKIGNITSLKNGAVGVHQVVLPDDVSLADGEETATISFTVEKTPKSTD